MKTRFIAFVAAIPLLEWVAGLVASIAAGVGFAFGENNIGFFVLVQIFFCAEMCAAMLVSGLDDEKEFGSAEFVRFWLMKALLLMVPLLGAGVDFAWYFMSGPDLFLGQDVHRYTTKTMLVGVLGYTFKEIAKYVLVIYKDLPFLKILMHRVDLIMNAGKEPPHYRRKWDPPYQGGDDAEGHSDTKDGVRGDSVRGSGDSV